MTQYFRYAHNLLKHVYRPGGVSNHGLVGWLRLWGTQTETLTNWRAAAKSGWIQVCPGASSLTSSSSGRNCCFLFHPWIIFFMLFVLNLQNLILKENFMSLTSFRWQITTSSIQQFGVLYPRDGPVWCHSFSKLPLESGRGAKVARCYIQHLLL